MAFMKDNNSELNLSTVGHRRWLLNPGMEKTGFGQCGRTIAHIYWIQLWVLPLNLTL